MPQVLESKAAANAAAWRDWLPIIAGLLLLFVPSFHDISGHWEEEDGAHGPVILAVVIWLVWHKRAALAPSAASHPAAVAGWALATAGLLLYVLGRSQEIALFEIGALAPLLAGILLLMRGWRALRAFWFPIVFVLFMLPLPGSLVDAVTGPLKQHVSEIAEQVLYTAGYPVARTGVVLTIGQYQLLVADACSGLNSMFSLSALGALYMYLSGRKGVLHNAIMLASILPIAFTANIVRVIILLLITYHMGDAAGQGFLHGGTGIVLLLVALAGLLALDAALARVLGSHKRA
jgi:exosortase B